MNTDNKTVSDKTADWLLFSTIKPSDNEEIRYWMGGVKTGRYNADRNIVLELGRLPKYWLPLEPTQEIKEQTKGVIEGLDFKTIEPIAEQFRINEGFTDDANISFCSGFYKGQKWFNDTHYMPLLEIFREFLKVSEMYTDNVNNYPDFKMGKGSTITHYFNTVIEKANNYLKQ